MKPLPFTYHLASYLSIALIFAQPAMQLSAGTINTLPPPMISEVQEDTPSYLSSPAEIAGVMENGMTYALLPSPTRPQDVWFKLSCKIPEDKDQEALSRLTQNALFYGTKEKDRETIASSLNDLGLDIEADGYIQANETEQSIQISLADCDAEKAQVLLSLMNEMIFNPDLNDSGIELARSNLLQNAEDLSEEAELALKSVTASEIRSYHSKWYKAENMHLAFAGLDDSSVVLEVINRVFNSHIQAPVVDPLVNEEMVDKNDSFSILTNAMVQRIEYTADYQARVIDGKIWMKEPSWINKKSNGRTLGAMLTLLGIGGMIIALPVVAPVALIAGGISTFTGIYFMTCAYLKDPAYVEIARQEDLQKGFAHAYSNNRAGVTLTPYERRALLLEEIVNHPQTLPKRPILLVADLYQLTDAVITEIFTYEEMEVLKRMKRDFIQQRNQYKMLKENLKNELINLSAPYILSRDAALMFAKDQYNQNYYVATKNALKDARDETLKQIEVSYKANQISFEDRESFIKDAKNYYEAAISTPEFQAGLASADSLLVKCELEIQATYLYNIEMCKQSINYNDRMTGIAQGKDSLIYFYDSELMRLLATYPVYLSTLNDYLDLRAI